MNVLVLCTGKTGKSFLEDGEQEYIKRLKHYVSLSYVQLPDIKGKNLSEEQIKQKEGEQVLQRIQNNDLVILLDEKGKQFTSEEFASEWQNWMNRGLKQVVIIIGGPYGFSTELYQRANQLISFSKMTFSHQMIRLFLFEQTYRAMTILRNEPYHHR